MASEIMPKIGFEGEATFRKELAEITAGTKTLASEAKAVEAAMRDETDAEKKSAAQKDILERQILSQREKLEKLEEGLKKSAQKYGEADVKTQKWQQAVFDASATLSDLEHKLGDTDNQVDEVSDSMGDAEQATAGWADVMKGSLLADAVKSGLGWIKDTISDIAGKTLEASKAGAAYADELLTLSTTTGVAVDTLQEFRYMEGLADVDTSAIAGTIQKLKKNMASAETQTQTYAKKMAEAAKETDEEKRAAKEASIELGATAAGFEKIGVRIKDNNGNFRQAEDVFFDMLDALGKIENETERDALAMTLMGKSATELNPLIEAGADALNELRKEAKDTGYVLSGSALSALGKQQDAMDRLDKKTEALSNRFAVKLAPSMERAYSLMGDTLDNPRVKRGLDVIGEGIGSLIDDVAELASQVLPDLFSVFTMGDPKLKYFSDTQLELSQRLEDGKIAHQEMIGEYKANAQGIVEETKRTEGLWKELQTLVGENGEVKKKDEERVSYINGELKKALGVQMELEGGILQGYKDQQKEIDNLIKKREAEALMAAGADAFAEADIKRNEALETAARLAPEVDKAYRDLERAQRNYGEALEYANSKWTDPEDEDKRLRFLDSYVGAVNDAKATYDELAATYDDARTEAQSYYADVDKWQRAQTAAANGNYNEVVRILADEFGVTLDYYKQKKELNEQEKKDLKEKISTAELSIAEYKKNLEAGLAGFSEAGLAELQGYVSEARKILDGKYVAENWLDGLKKGLGNSAKLREVGQAAASVAQGIVRTTRETLQIKSPSRVAAYLGEMWDEGMIRGLEEREDKLRLASERLSDLVIDGASGLSPSVGSYAGGVTTAPIGTYGGAGSTSSYTTNMGGITVRVDGAGAVNEDVLAQRVAVHLTHELQRAQRGGRL